MALTASMSLLAQIKVSHVILTIPEHMMKYMLYLKKWLNDPDARNCFYQLFEKAQTFNYEPGKVKEFGVYLLRSRHNRKVCGRWLEGPDIYADTNKVPELPNSYPLPSAVLFIHTHPLFKRLYSAQPSRVDLETARKHSKYGTKLYVIGIAVFPKDIGYDGVGEVWGIIPNDLGFRQFRRIKESDGNLLKNNFCQNHPNFNGCKI